MALKYSLRVGIPEFNHVTIYGLVALVIFKSSFDGIAIALNVPLLSNDIAPIFL